MRVPNLDFGKRGVKLVVHITVLTIEMVVKANDTGSVSLIS